MKGPSQRAKSNLDRIPSGETAPRYQEIADRAYQIYLSRNDGDGDALSDWLQAEREVVESQAPIGGLTTA